MILEQAEEILEAELLVGEESLDIKALRLHFGFAPQPHNERFFAGVDKTVTFLDRNLILRGDFIQTNDKEDALYSVGFLYELGAKDGGDEPA